MMKKGTNEEGTEGEGGKKFRSKEKSVDDFIEDELNRLQDPEVNDEDILIKEDFFDIILLIKLKS